MRLPMTIEHTSTLVCCSIYEMRLLCFIAYLMLFYLKFDEIYISIKNIDDVLRLLREAEDTLNLHKCHFSRTTVEYFGHILMPGLLTTASKKTDAISTTVFSTDRITMKTFLGACCKTVTFPNFSSNLS